MVKSTSKQVRAPSSAQAHALEQFRWDRHADRYLDGEVVQDLTEIGLIVGRQDTGKWGYILTRRGWHALSTPKRQGIIDPSIPADRASYRLGDRDPGEMRLGDVLDPERPEILVVDGGWVAVEGVQKDTLMFNAGLPGIKKFGYLELRRILAHLEEQQGIVGVVTFAEAARKTLAPFNVPPLQLQGLLGKIAQLAKVAQQDQEIAALKAEVNALKAQIKELEW